jgi:tetratricopeptide (TPR) repeat protein
MSSKAEKYLEEAQIAMNKRNYSKAIKYFEDYLSLAPDDKKILYSLADAYVFNGDVQVAIKLYLQVAEHLRTKGFIMKSVAVCKRVLNLDNGNFFAKDLMHRLYQDKSSEEESSKIFTQSYQTVSEAQKQQQPSSKPEPEFLPVFAADMKHTTTSEISISGLQAVSGEAASEKLTGNVAFKETVAMPKVKESIAAEQEAVQEKIEIPDSLTGGFVAVTPEDFYLDSNKPASVAAYDYPGADKDKASQMHSVSSAPASKRTQTQEIRILKAKDLLFGELTELEYLKLIDLMEIRTFQPGEIVVREGNPGDSMFIICNGDVSVVTKDKSGKDVQLADLSEGDFFGEVSLLTGRPRTATIYAISYTEALELKRISLPEIENNFPQIREKLEDFYHRRTMHTIETLIGQ